MIANEKKKCIIETHPKVIHILVKDFKILISNLWGHMWRDRDEDFTREEAFLKEEIKSI